MPRRQPSPPSRPRGKPRLPRTRRFTNYFPPETRGIVFLNVSARSEPKCSIPTETSAKLLFASVAAVCDRRIAGIFVRNGGHRPPLQLFCRGLQRDCDLQPGWRQRLPWVNMPNRKQRQQRCGRPHANGQIGMAATALRLNSLPRRNPRLSSSLNFCVAVHLNA